LHGEPSPGEETAVRFAPTLIRKTCRAPIHLIAPGSSPGQALRAISSLREVRHASMGSYSGVVARSSA